MSNSLTFLNASWFWPVLACWGILILIFIWKEWATSGNKRLSLKIFLAILAITSLAMLALKPAIPMEINQDRAIIITENVKQKQLDSLKKEYRNIKEINYFKEGALPSMGNAKEVFVLGSGIPSYDFWAFENIPVTFLSGEELSGIIQLNYKQENQIGKRLVVKIDYANPKLNNRLLLENAGGTALDSIVFDAEENGFIQLSTDLKVAGTYVFRITEKNESGEVQYRYPLPIQVADKKALKILILNAYPTFEIKYLKNFLAELNHELIVKNRMSTGKFKFEFFNLDPIRLGRLTASSLEDFELVILDSESLKGLSTAERNALLKAIKTKGLGLLILDEASAHNSLYNFSIFDFQRTSANDVILNDLGVISVNSQPYRLKKEFGLEEIHSSTSSILSAYKRVGQGRIGTTVLENTWQLQLEGNREAYHYIWAGIVEQLSKRTSELASWQPVNEMVSIDQPFAFQIRTSLDNPRVLDQNNLLIPLKQNLTVSELWSGTTYPKEMGWQTLKLEQDSTITFNYYVYQPTDWQSIKSYQNKKANFRNFQQNSIDKNQIKKAPTAIDPLWFFGLFLFGIASLWLEPKL
jgi:hypothetical protein